MKFDLLVAIKITEIIKSTDTLRDCRKSPKMAILAISHVMKSNSYEHQNHKFKVFRQSLQIPTFTRSCDMAI